MNQTIFYLNVFKRDIIKCHRKKKKEWKNSIPQNNTNKLRYLLKMYLFKSTFLPQIL